MSNRKKGVVIIIAVLLAFTLLLLALLSVIFARGYAPSKKAEISYLGINELILPQSLNQNEFGLFWHSYEHSYKSTSSLSKEAFDVDKPTLIFFHNSQSYTFEEKEYWLDYGYNVGVFLWSEFADDADLAQISAKFTDKNKTFFRGEDRINASLSDAFLAYYLDFMYALDGYFGNEIRFLGAGIGSELSLSIINRLDSLADEEIIGLDYLPDRIALASPVIINEDVCFLGAKLTEKRGIALEIIGSFEDMDILSYAQSLNYSGNSLNWYSASLDMPIPRDSVMYNNPDYSFSARTPLEFVLARRGISYQTDDGLEIKSTNLETALISGLAFLDVDQNGVYNERIANRVNGVKIEIYLNMGAEDILLNSTFTTKGGFFSLSVAQIYANSFDKLYVKAYPPNGYTLTKRAANTLASNDINPDNKSDIFMLAHMRSVKNICVGIKAIS